MQLYSEQLETNIDFTDLGTGVDTPYDILERVILYEINASVHYALLLSDGLHFVFQCFISGDGRQVEGIGETTSATLNDQIAQNFPARIAARRAFTYAAIRFLKIPPRDYKLLFEDENEDIPDIPEPDLPAENTKQHSVTKSVYNKEEPQAKIRGNSKNKSQEDWDYAQTIVTIGRTRGKNYTVAQLAESDPKSLEYIANEYAEQYPPSSEEKKRIVEACRRWIEEHGDSSIGKSA